MEVGVVLLVLIALIWLMPFLIVITSSKVSGTEKLAWLLAMIFISWFAWIFYALLAPIKEERREP